jgi:hypothetical protein
MSTTQATLGLMACLSLVGCTKTNAPAVQELPQVATGDRGLEPAAGVFDESIEWEYLAFIRDVLFREGPPHHCLQMVSRGGAEQALFIPCVDGEETAKRTVFHVVALDDVRAAYAAHQDPSTVRVTVTSADVDDTLWRALDDAFWASVSATKYQRRNRLVADGTLYEFVSARTAVGTRAGRTHEPEPTSSAGQIVTVARLLAEYADNPMTRSKVRERLLIEASRLHQR